MTFCKTIYYIHLNSIYIYNLISDKICLAYLLIFTTIFISHPIRWTHAVCAGFIWPGKNYIWFRTRRQKRRLIRLLVLHLRIRTMRRGGWSLYIIVQNLEAFIIPQFCSADSVMIISLVRPPTHGRNSLKGFKGESVKFKWITSSVSLLRM